MLLLPGSTDKKLPEDPEKSNFAAVETLNETIPVLSKTTSGTPAGAGNKLSG